MNLHFRPRQLLASWTKWSYAYQPLDPAQKQIRLLELEPGGYHDPLLARLLLVSLDDMPVYNTISYLWGDPSKTSKLLISGTRLSVPVNTALALRRMRLDDTVRVVWIDAVCINQKDIHERGQQVSIMGDIYRRSVGNLIHLTDDQVMGERAIRLASQIDKEARAETNEWKEFHSMARTKDGNGKISFREQRQDLDYEALWFLMRIPWFRWLEYTAQLANTSGVIESSGRNCLRILASWADPVLDGYHFLKASREYFHILLANARAFERSEPRDGVFAVLGILEEPIGIVPDYTKSVQALSQETTRLVLQKVNHLSALDTIKHEEDLGNGCSWAYPLDRLDDPAVQPYPHITSGLAASRGLAPPTKLDEDSGDADTIVLEGFKTDNVFSTTPVCTADTFDGHFSFRHWLYHAAIKLGDHIETERETLAKLAEAITEGHLREGDLATVEDMDAVTAYLSALMRSQGMLEPTTMDQEYNQSLYDLYNEVGSHCDFTYVRWRLLFRTTSGRIGLGPKVARLGDIVVVVRGGDYPSLLRSLGEEYQYIGAAYMHDIMRGEAVAEAQVKGLEEQEFVVR
ncbi:hypothetical protein LTR56_008222 [Elasticomyces elasticus]|nr:hypothetical protein LTR56_008222 [Elasticomyces elasticus]KAK3661787.1 hypothetical protein LTR22_007368 [Elasticomyces elasticus]KAK4924392.1 hypothetical protein LTR49_008481 [Elasticomyces elasticus]KAK5762644.1 hypothetical protein LTS12_007236 [Elasticomyces elasticus]